MFNNYYIEIVVNLLNSLVFCPVGSYYHISSGSCSLCPVGTYNNKEGAAQCTKCPDGQTTLSTGATSSTMCGGGKKICKITK